MTEEKARLSLCAWAQDQIGYREGSNNKNKFAENPALAQMYGWMPQNQPWCDVFVDAGFIECFGLANACAMTYQPPGAGSALCRQSAQYYREHGAFVSSPKIGDQAFFYASGDINHTGIVIRVSGGSVVTVEGNSSDMVAERVYQMGDSRIAGYGRPNWAAAADEELDSAETADHIADDGNMADQTGTETEAFYTLRLPVLRRGSKCDAVTAAQIVLLGLGIGVGPDGADGKYGTNTEAGVKKFQAGCGLSADGIIGAQTGAELYGGEVPLAGKEEDSQTETEPRTGGFWGIFRRRKK